MERSTPFFLLRSLSPTIEDCVNRPLSKGKKLSSCMVKAKDPYKLYLDCYPHRCPVLLPLHRTTTAQPISFRNPTLIIASSRLPSSSSMNKVFYSKFCLTTLECFDCSMML